MSDMQVQAELKLKDNLSKPAGTALEALGKSAAKTGTAVDAIGKNQGMQRTAKDAADAARNMSGMARTAQETSRGMDAAALSAKRFRDGAQDAARLIASMRDNMQGVQRTIRDAAGQMQGLGRGAATAMRGAAALGTAGYVAKAALQKPVSLEAQSLNAANTIYSDLTPQERINKAKGLRASSFNLARQYGGTAEQALQIQTELAAGGFDDAQVSAYAPSALRAVIAGEANVTDISSVIIKGVKEGVIKPDNVGVALDAVRMGGKLGSMEMKDLAKHLPSAISMGAGMKDYKGYLMHIANLEAVEVGSPDKDAAGNNYKNLLQKLSAEDVRKRFKDKAKLNLQNIELQAVSKGQDPVTAMVDAIDGILKKDKGYKKLRAKLDAAKNDEERQNVITQMLGVIQGGKLSQLMPDMQAMQGLLALISQRGYRDEIFEKLKSAEGTLAQDHAVIASGTEYKEQLVATEKDYAASKTHDATKPYIDAALDFAGSLARENPAAATAAYAGGTAMTAGAAAGTAGALLGGGSVVQGAAKGLFTGVEATAKASPLLMLGGAMYKVHQTATDASLTAAEKDINNMETYGQFGGALSGAAMGAAAGSVVPLLGNIAGGILGGIMGYFAGGKAGKATGDLMWGDEAAAQKGQPSPQETAAQTAQLLQQQPINATIQLNVELDGDAVAAAVEKRQLRESSRH